MTTFEYWKGVYLLYGDCHTSQNVSKNFDLLNSWWEQISDKENVSKSFLPANSTEEELRHTYIIYDDDLGIWTFTDKFFKELANE